MAIERENPRYETVLAQYDRLQHELQMIVGIVGNEIAQDTQKAIAVFHNAWHQYSQHLLRRIHERDSQIKRLLDDLAERTGE
jgi:hypothetical protein